jgi:hypothetical protein
MIRREPELHEAIVTLEAVASELRVRGRMAEMTNIMQSHVALEWACGIENVRTERFARLLKDALMTIRIGREQARDHP